MSTRLLHQTFPTGYYAFHRHTQRLSNEPPSLRNFGLLLKIALALGSSTHTPFSPIARYKSNIEKVTIVSDYISFFLQFLRCLQQCALFLISASKSRLPAFSFHETQAYSSGTAGDVILYLTPHTENPKQRVHSQIVAFVMFKITQTKRAQILINHVLLMFQRKNQDGGKTFTLLRKSVYV